MFPHPLLSVEGLVTHRARDYHIPLVDTSHMFVEVAFVPEMSVALGTTEGLASVCLPHLFSLPNIHQACSVSQYHTQPLIACTFRQVHRYAIYHRSNICELKWWNLSWRAHLHPVCSSFVNPCHVFGKWGVRVDTFITVFAAICGDPQVLPKVFHEDTNVSKLLLAKAALERRFANLIFVLWLEMLTDFVLIIK